MEVVIFLKKSYKNIWWVFKKFLPLHSLLRTNRSGGGKGWGRLKPVNFF